MLLLPAFCRSLLQHANNPARRRTGAHGLYWTGSIRSSRCSTTRLMDLAPPKRQRRSKSDDSTLPSSQATTALEWERFEFGDAPKLDQRFDDNDNNNKRSASEQLATLDPVEETRQDEQSAAALNQKQDAWERLPSATVQSAIQALTPFCQPERIERIRTVLDQRTVQTRFLFENPANPSNVWACLRTIESFGIQHVDIIVDSRLYEGKMALNQKRGMRTAMGAAQWLTLRNHRSTAEAVQYLKEEQGCRILASDLSPTSQDIREIDWPSLMAATAEDDNNKIESSKPIVIVMGNEERGISEEMRELADATFTLPMVGFAESFNLSVATAITLAHLSAATASLGASNGPLRPGNLPPHEYETLLLRGLLNSISQKRVIPIALRKEGIELPPELL